MPVRPRKVVIGAIFGGLRSTRALAGTLTELIRGPLTKDFRAIDCSYERAQRLILPYRIRGT